MSSALAAWDIYAESLEPMGYGYPLWGPEPSSDFGPVGLGDVGYIQHGRFYFLFNTMLPRSHPTNKRGVPEHFERFTYEHASPPNNSDVVDIMQSALHSQGVTDIDSSATASISSRVPGASLKSWEGQYQCNTESGALLLLNGGAKTTKLDCDNHIRDYILKHIANWRTFARDGLGIDLEEKDLLFVSGHSMATEWGVIAFRGARPGSRLVITSGTDQEEWHVTITDGPSTASDRSRRTCGDSADARQGPASNAIVFARIGPMNRESRREKKPQGTQRDQCVFIQYHRVKTAGVLRSRRVVDK
ncbi:hypothetical protein C8Q76DRAFT_800460 [Earliella scabrosa]|nr:hypothetical protein C8Q76DRAFT_800460 [Earliella scabrosa]